MGLCEIGVPKNPLIKNHCGHLGGHTPLLDKPTSIYGQLPNVVVATIIERKLRSAKIRLFTVPCCSTIPFSSEGMNKQFTSTYPFLFFVRRSIILVCSIIVFSPIFLTFTNSVL